MEDAMMSAVHLVDMGERLRRIALPAFCGDHNAASLFAHRQLMRTLDREQAHPGGREVLIGPRRLQGVFEAPLEAQGVVILPRTRAAHRDWAGVGEAAAFLRACGFATLCVSLYSPGDAVDERAVDNAAADGACLVEAIDWLHRAWQSAHVSVALVACAWHAGAAIIAATQRAARIRTIVWWGGLQGLPQPVLTGLRMPILLLVGAQDAKSLSLSRTVCRLMRGEARLSVVPGSLASLEDGSPARAALDAAGEWLLRHWKEVDDAKSGV
jgi:hypothetical protein